MGLPGRVISRGLCGGFLIVEGGVVSWFLFYLDGGEEVVDAREF